MKTLPSLSLICALAIFAGCATPVGKVRFPEAGATFAPKQTYAVGYDKLWNVTLEALDKNRIAAASADKSSGIIQTDSIEGPSSLIALGLVAAQNTRYKYNISLRNQPNGDVKMNIFCKIESTMKGSAGSSQWADVTSQNSERGKKLENWLYEQIEQGM